MKIPILNSVRKICSNRFEWKYFVTCRKCGEYMLNGWCEECLHFTERNESNFIIYIPLEQQIQFMLRKYFDQVVNYSRKNLCDECSEDIHSGSITNNVKRAYNDSIVLTFTLNVDGGNISTKSKKSLWPVQLYQNYLPPDLRYKLENVIVSTLYLGEKKPDMSKLLLPLALEIKALTKKGIMCYTTTEFFFKFIPNIALVSCDLQARAPMMGMQHFAGYYSCPHCLHPGIWVPGNTKGGYVRFISVDVEPQLRTDIETANIYNRIFNNAMVPINGLTSVTPMMMFPNFNCATSFITDYMHCVLLRVMNLLIDIWMGSRKSNMKPLSLRHRQLFDKRIMAIKPNSIMDGPPKSLFDRKLWKAIDYKSMLLYFLPCSMNGIFEGRIIHNFRKLSAAIYMLLGSKIGKDVISDAENLLQEFCDDFEKIYGKQQVTMSIHLLRHLSQCVRTAGPLWVYSVFGFERNMGRLVKWARGTRFLLPQIASTYCLLSPTPKDVKYELKLSGQIRTPNSTVNDILLNLNLVGAKCYSQIKMGSIIFKSEMSKPTKCVDHFVEIAGDIGAVVIYTELNQEIFAIYRSYEAKKMICHFTIFQPTGMFKALNVSDSMTKLFYIHIGATEAFTKKVY